MYIMYFISVLANIPLSGVRANIMDNTRSKEGKYRPYIVKMGIPSAIVTILFVWFPYDRFGALFGEGTLFGKDRSYVITCAIILIFNFIQNFFYYFFSEAYDNLIHALSPNTQERADVSTIKGVVYLLAPSILSLAMPIFAQLFTNNNMYDIRLYRYIYAHLAILSVILSIVVYANTKEKMVQAKTHVIQIKFMDSLREVLRNGSVVGDVIAKADTSGMSYFSLYDGDILQMVCGVLILASIAGAVINVIPYFFYDLAELKQQGMIRVLKIRAFFEDFGNNTLSDDNLVEVVEMVEKANELANREPARISKDEIKAAKKDSAAKKKIKAAKKASGTKAERKAAVKSARQERSAQIKVCRDKRREAIQLNQEIRLAPYVIKEMATLKASSESFRQSTRRRYTTRDLQVLACTAFRNSKVSLKRRNAFLRKRMTKKSSASIWCTLPEQGLRQENIRTSISPAVKSPFRTILS